MSLVKHAPRLALLSRSFSRQPTLTVDQIESSIRAALSRINEASTLHKKKIGIGVGSRGIAGYDQIVGSVVRELTIQYQAIPTIIPAMGSHAGSTGEAQLLYLAAAGISPQNMNVNFDGSMETLVIGRTSDGMPVHYSTAAKRQDVVIAINRCKPHTHTQRAGSGIAKMLAIGFGKRIGASTVHEHAEKRADGKSTEALGDVIWDAVDTHISVGSNFIGGIGIVENAADHTAYIGSVLRHRMRDDEEPLVKKARALMPGLPLMDIDLLLIDQIGKNFSGTGLDPNVTGRFTDRVLRPGFPKIKLIAARRLSKETHGNAFGCGLLDFATERLTQQIDQNVTDVNVRAAYDHKRGAGRAPLMERLGRSDRHLFELALAELKQTYGIAPEDARILFIPNTLQLGEMWVSTPARGQARKDPYLNSLGQALMLGFSGSGHLRERFMFRERA